MPNPDEPDWDQIVERYAERVFRIAFRILGSVHDAEDVMQDVFSETFKLHRNGPVRTWPGLIVRLSTLRAIDKLRARRSFAQLNENDRDVRSRATNDRPEHALIAAELSTWLRAELDQLPDQQAAVFSLAYFEQLTRSEIADALEMAPEAVSNSLHKARRRLMGRMTIFQGNRS